MIDLANKSASSRFDIRGRNTVQDSSHSFRLPLPPPELQGNLLGASDSQSRNVKARTRVSMMPKKQLPEDLLVLQKELNLKKIPTVTVATSSRLEQNRRLSSILDVGKGGSLKSPLKLN